MNVTVRYVCTECGWRWTREVRARSVLVLDRPIAATCPGCAQDGPPGTGHESAKGPPVSGR